MDAISIIATNLLADLVAMPDASLFVEARLHLTNALNENAHLATVGLYTQPAAQPDRATIFRGDEADDYLNVSISWSTASNKRFIEALKKELHPSWRYLSFQCQLGFDQPGARNVSARFPYQRVLDALNFLQGEVPTEEPDLQRNVLVHAVSAAHVLRLLKPLATHLLVIKDPQPLLVLARGGGQVGICHIGAGEVRLDTSASPATVQNYLFRLAKQHPHKVEYHKFVAELGELVASEALVA